MSSNNTTKKDTTGKTIAPPSPLPAGGQAPAALEQRSEAAYRTIEQFGKNFGTGKKWQPPSEKEFNKRRDQQKKALLGMKS